MPKDPAVLLYPADFLTGTMLMDYDTKGRYITLLCLQQQTGPIKEKDFKKICEEKFDEISEKFEQDSKGNYFNRRMKQEIDKRKKFTESRRSNGSKGGRPKKTSEKLEESIKKPYGFAYGLHMGNHMGNENININNNNITDLEHVTDQEDLTRDLIDQDNLIDQEDLTKEKPKKKDLGLSKMGEFQNVILSEEELEKLKDRFPYDWQERIESLSQYMKSKGKRYKSHYATILSWARKEEKDAGKRADSKAQGRAESTAGTGDEYEKFFK